MSPAVLAWGSWETMPHGKFEDDDYRWVAFGGQSWHDPYHDRYMSGSFEDTQSLSYITNNQARGV